MKKNKLICIGSIGKPRGLKGEFFLNSFCNPPKNIISYTKYIKTNNDIDLKIEYIKENNFTHVHCVLSGGNFVFFGTKST